MLELKGCIVTSDAIGCQTDITKKIRGKKADYVLALKGNQGKLHEETKDYFEAGLANDWKHMQVDYHEESDTTVNASVKRKKLMAALDDDLRETIIRQALLKTQV